MPENYSPTPEDYLRAFEKPLGRFLFYYSFGENGNVFSTSLTRGEFWPLAKRAASVIRNSGCARGNRFAICFRANHPNDLAFRLATAMTGTTPATINLHPDTIDRILYEIALVENRTGGS